MQLDSGEKSLNDLVPGPPFRTRPSFGACHLPQCSATEGTRCAVGSPAPVAATRQPCGSRWPLSSASLGVRACGTRTVPPPRGPLVWGDEPAQRPSGPRSDPPSLLRRPQAWPCPRPWPEGRGTQSSARSRRTRPLCAQSRVPRSAVPSSAAPASSVRWLSMERQDVQAPLTWTIAREPRHPLASPVTPSSGQRGGALCRADWLAVARSEACGPGRPGRVEESHTPHSELGESRR